MRKSCRKVVAMAAGVAGIVGLTAGPAFAHECVNASKKDPTAGAQIIQDDDDVVFATTGLVNRFEKGLIGPEGEGFHGVFGFVLGDGSTLSTYIVGPDGEIPLQAQLNGPACKGITNIEVYFSECVE
jgi:hypothetical protein